MSHERSGDSTIEDEYPSIRRVLTDQDKVANAYCAVKWTVWQASHLALVIGAIVIGGIFAILIGTGLAVSKIVRTVVPDSIQRRLVTGTDSAYQKLSRGTGDAVEKAQEAPVTRRVYNECPVSIKRTPRYQQKLSDWIDRKF